MERQDDVEERRETATPKSAGVLRLEREQGTSPPPRRRGRPRSPASEPSSTGSPPKTESEVVFGEPPAPPASSDREAAAELLDELEPTAEAATAPSPSSSAELRALLEALFVAWNLCADARESWARWRLTDPERRVMVDAWLPVAIKYEASLRLGPEIAAVAVTVAVLAPRLRHASIDERPESSSETPGYVVS